MSQYIIRVEGHLSSGLIARLPHLRASRRAETVVHGRMTRQSELAEVLDYLSEHGIRVVEVHRLRDPASAAAGEPEPHRGED